jgi:mono/diheme cytochrome c family protein
MKQAAFDADLRSMVERGAQGGRAMQKTTGILPFPTVFGCGARRFSKGAAALCAVAATLLVGAPGGSQIPRGWAAGLFVTAQPGRNEDPPQLYTLKQAEAGKAIFMTNCARCHGKDLQGATAPANAGTTFLTKAKEVGWSVATLRSLVVANMPMDRPGSLSAQQYADVLSFLLASDCYPAGRTPFPTQSTAMLERTKLQPLRHVNGANSKGICKVK